MEYYTKNGVVIFLNVYVFLDNKDLCEINEYSKKLHGKNNRFNEKKRGSR